MKKVIRLTEDDIRRLVKKSVNRILRENMEWFNDRQITDNAGYLNSVKKFNENPVDIYDDNYEPSDDEINDAISEFNLDDDPNFNWSDGYENSTYQFENKSHLNKVIKEATNEIWNNKNSGHISFGDEEENDWTGIGVDEDLQRIHYIALGIINNSKDRYYRGINHKPSKRDIEAANNILNITRQAGCTNASIKNVRY